MTTVNKTKYLEFKTAKSPSGSDWYYVKRTNDSNAHDSAVCITVLAKINGIYNFLLLKTKRPPLCAEQKSEFCIESPAGLIADESKDENLYDCIKKELSEETGLRADKIYIELTNSSSSSGLTSETLSYATAVVENTNITVSPLSDGGIIAERIYVPVDKILDYIGNLDKKKYSVASAMVCGVFFALNRINGFR